jgi:chemotaxis signal transduction protein
VSAVDPELARRIAELRASFDNAFALPPETTAITSIGLLAIGVGTAGYAIRMTELSDVQAARKVVPLPGARPEMLGLAGIRGRLVPVYSLAALLGQAVTRAWTWLAICGTEQPIGLTFDELEGYVQASPADLVPAAGVEGSRSHVRELLRKDGRVAMVVSAASIVAMLRNASGSATDGGAREANGR